MRDDKTKPAPGEGRKPQKKLVLHKKTVRDLEAQGRAARIKGGQKPTTWC
jgi:hypothetical protein